MSVKKELFNKLQRLEQEHRNLDEILIRLQDKQTVNLLQIQRLKKRKLILKDRIIILRDRLEPEYYCLEGTKIFIIFKGLSKKT